MTSGVRARSIGVLSFAHYHANFWSEVFRDQGRLAGVWDDDTARGQDAANRFGAPFHENLDDLLACCDAVAICSETCRHAELVEAAARRGLPVLLEKPTAHTLDSAQRIADTVSRHALFFMQSFPKRFDPVSHYLREQVVTGSLGTLSLVRIRHGHFYGLDPEFRKRWYVRKALAGGGALLDEGIHGADLLAWLFGLPEKVSATVSHAALGLEVEDLGIANFTWANGLVAELTTSFCFAAADVSIELYGSAGTVLVSGIDLASRDITQSSFVRIYKHLSEPRQWQTVDLTPRFKIGQFHHQNALAFVAALDQGASAPVTVDDGLRAQRMIAAAYQAAAEARCVTIE